MDSLKDNSFLTDGAVLLADASGERLSMCLAKDGAVAKETEAAGGALENIFPSMRGILEASRTNPGDIRALGFCRGPGSILGIRILSVAFSALRAANPGILLFTWDLLDAYAELLREKNHGEFSIICPSRKGYANTLAAKGSQASRSEILSSDISETPQPRFFVRQRAVADKNFEGLEEAHFGAAAIFELLKRRPKLASALDARETADAETLAKREYVKWNFQAHS